MLLSGPLPDPRDAAVEPQAQHAVGRVAHAEPYHRRGPFRLHGSRAKVFAFRDDDRARLQGVSPDGSILGLAESGVFDVAGFMTRFTQLPCKGRRQLGINPEFHFASDRKA